MKHDLGNTGLLLMMGALPLGCAAADDGEAGGATPTATNPSADDAGTEDDGPATADDGPATADDGPTTVSTGDDDAGTTGAVPEICEGYAQHYAECFPEYGTGMAAQYCASYLGYGEEYGPACTGALEDVFACLTTIDCAAWESERTPICEAEYAAVTTACPWEPDTTGTGGSSSSGESGDEGNGSSTSG
jgi:hypothetical protein